MSEKRRQYREGTRAARFLAIRDAIMAEAHRMRPCEHGCKQLAVGPFLIFYAPPGACGLGRGYNLQIWPGGSARWGVVMQANKVANVDWNQWDEVDILSFRGGAWEQELLELLTAPSNVAYMPRR